MEKMKILDMEYKQIYTKSIPYEELRKDWRIIMAKVELIGKYDMSIGTVLIINSGSVLHTGDTIDVEYNKYQIKKLPMAEYAGGIMKEHKK